MLFVATATVASVASRINIFIIVNSDHLTCSRCNVRKESTLKVEEPFKSCAVFVAASATYRDEKVRVVVT